MLDAEGIQMKYKFVSSGQSVDDAAIISQTLLGTSLKAPSPVNLQGERNQASDLLILWTRRSRIAGGMIPNSDVPVGEEKEEFQLEIYNGSTLLRTLRNIFVGNPMGAVLEYDGASKFTHITGNSITPGAAGTSRFKSIQQISQGENFTEATLIGTSGAGGDAVINFGLISTSKDWRSAAATDSDYHAELNCTGLSEALNIYQGSTLLYTEDASSYSTAGVRIRIELGAGEVRFFKNYAGPGSQTVAVSSIVPAYPFWLFVHVVRFTGSAYINNVNMSIYPQPAAVYTAAQQTVDFGSIQSSVKVRIYQVSAVTGRGDYAEATI